MGSLFQNPWGRAGRHRVGRPAARGRTGLKAVAGVALLAAATSCTPGSAGTGTVSGSAGPTAAPSVAAPPVSAEINQLRDNYSKQIVAIQLTNNSPDPLTVVGAELGSALFSAAIPWQPPAGGIELPPGQAKILPAQLPAPVCSMKSAQSPAAATVTLRLAGAAGTAPTMVVPAPDQYGVLSRNNGEMCLAQVAAAVAAIRLAQELDVAADAQTAVVRLIITPRSIPGAANPDSTGTLTIDRIDGTTLLEEDGSAPWPRSVTIAAGGPGQELRLGIRPARCDPHAVAEDKVGTLLPLRVHAGGRDGVLKIDADPLLRGRIYDFVTAACGRQ